MEDYVERCIHSVMEQEYPAECVIVDDCSTDRSMEKVRQLIDGYEGKMRFKIITHISNKGLSMARNSGIDAATGEYMLFLDSDDELEPKALELFAREVERHPGVDMVVGTYRPIPGRNDLCIKVRMDYVTGGKRCKRLFMKENLFPDTAHNKLVRSELVRKYNLYFYPDIYHEDNLWKWSCAKCVTSLAFLRRPTMIYNQRSNSITSKPIEERMCSLVKVLSEKMCNVSRHDAGPELCNVVGFMHRLDRISRTGDIAAIEKARGGIQQYFDSALHMALDYKVVGGLLSLMILKFNLKLMPRGNSLLFRILNAVGERIVN